MVPSTIACMPAGCHASLSALAGRLSILREAWRAHKLRPEAQVFHSHGSIAMGKRILNRKDLRADYDAAERRKEGEEEEVEEDEGDDDDDEEEGDDEETDEAAAEEEGDDD